MTSKNLYFDLVREDLKRRIWAVGLAFLVFFLCLPVVSAMVTTEAVQNYENWIRNGTVFTGYTLETKLHERILDAAHDILGFENFFLSCTIVVAAFVAAITGFQHLNSKKQVDFYHSVPVRREILFTVRYLTGIGIMLAMYLLNLILAVIVFAVNGAGPAETIGPALITLLANMAGFCLIYGLMTIVMMLTGNFFIAVLGGIVVFSYIPVAALMCQTLMEIFFITTPGHHLSELFDNVVGYGSPFLAYIRMMSNGNNLNYSEYAAILPSVLKMFAVSVVMQAIATVLYRLRPSEAAGKAMAFSRTKAPIKFLLVTPCAAYAAVTFWLVYYRIGWAVFGFLMGLVISHCLIEIIYHFDFRKLFANLPHMGICAAFALAIIGFFYFDPIGYDRYVPKEGAFSSAAVTAPSLDDWHDYGIARVNADGAYEWNYLDENNYVENNMTVTDYGVIAELANAGAARAKEIKKWKLGGGPRYGSSEEEGPGFWTYMNVAYRLRNGKTVYRSYRVNVTELRDTFDRLYAGGEYKAGVYPVYGLAAESVTGVYAAKAGKISEITTDAELTGELFTAYKEDLAALTLEQRANEVPVASLRFLTVSEQEYIGMMTRSRVTGYTGSFRLDDMREVNFFPVYPSFEKTITLLADAGYDVDERLSADQIARIEVVNNYPYSTEQKGYAYYDYETEQSSEDDRHFTVRNDGSAENEKTIEEIVALAKPADLVKMNSLHGWNDNLEFRVFLKDEEDGMPEESYLDYILVTREVPESLKERIRYDRTESSSIHYGLNGNDLD